jgi:predicted SAM-dependent methyltransferase
MFSAWQEVRVDADPAVSPDIVSSLVAVDYPSSSADGVYCCHALEHVERWLVPQAVAEMYRVLKPGGQLMLLVPDLEAWARDIVTNPHLLEVPRVHPAHGSISVLDAIFGPGYEIEAGNDHQRHRTAFTFNSLMVHLVVAGFVNISIERVLWQLVAYASKPS